MHRVVLSLLLLASAGCLLAAERRTFALASGDFPLDGKPFQIISGFCCAPAPIPFPVLHVNTGDKFREMIEFRDWYTAKVGVKLIVRTNRGALDAGANPYRLGTAPEMTLRRA